MNSYDSVRAFASRVSLEVDRLDIAISNAGVRRFRYAQSSYDWEETLVVNTLSTTLFGFLLLPKLKEHATPASPSYLQFVSSRCNCHAGSPRRSKHHRVVQHAGVF